MRISRATGDPFAVKLSEDARNDLAIWLSTELQNAYDARAAIIQPGGALDYAHFLYEQGRTPAPDRRWPGAADLPSYLVTEKVDALRSRVVKTIFAEPFSIVEGWGPDASRAPFVEEFHEWKRKEERLRSALSRTLHNALIEQNGVLEVLDRSDVRLVKKLQQIAAVVGEDGTTPLDSSMTPELQMDEQGRPVDATDEQQPSVQAVTSTYQRMRVGPGYRVISQRDFLFLPGHAADKSELYGMFKRVYLRVDQIQELADQGVYDKDVLTRITESSDRDTIQPALERQGQVLAEQREGTQEKELWSGLLLYDCDKDGLAEWYYVTVHVPSRTILRIRHDDLGVPRFLVFTPFPRPDALYGYSFVLDKLITSVEEHTALRNMIADRSTLATTPPMKRRQGALWDPEEQPWGSGQTIDVRDMDEVTPFTVPDVPNSALQREAAILQAAERITGVNDTAVGIQAQEKRTATEVQNVAIAGAVRTEEIVENIQEELELLDQVRNALWIRTLQEQPDGIDAPESVVRSLETKNLTLTNGKFTAQMLRGNFRFKPHGSVETADKSRMRADYNGWLQAMAGLAKLNPIAMQMLQDPGVLKSIVEQGLRLYNVPDKQPFMQALQRAVQAMIQRAQEAMAMRQAMAGAVPGNAVPGMAPQPQIAPGGGGAGEQPAPSPMAGGVQ